MKTFTGVKVGDVVVRNLAGVIMKLLVTAVDDDRIWCRDWSFDRVTGIEIDDDLHWGPSWGITGSYLIGVEPAN